MFRTRLARAGILLVCLAGCSPQPTADTLPVSGVITLNGAPVAGAEVAFINDDTASGKPARGTTDASGNYTLSTYLSASAQPAGALAGSYHVTVVKRKAAAQPPPPGASPEEIEKYARSMYQQPAAPVRSGPKGPPPKTEPKIEINTELPEKYAQVTTTDLTATVEPGKENKFTFDLNDAD